MSLRTFHLIFILVVIVGAEMFAMRELWYYQQTGGIFTLAMGLLSLVGGLGLSAYSLVFVRKMDAAAIR